MKKETFEAIQKYESALTELYFDLEKQGLDVDTLHDLYIKFNEVHDQLLKLGEYKDVKAAVNKEGYLNKKYNEYDKYLKLLVIYEYDNGYCLCQTTAGHFELVPKDLISYDI